MIFGAVTDLGAGESRTSIMPMVKPPVGPSTTRPARPSCDHEWQYARCAVVRGEYLVEVKCRVCGKRELL
jgi:hypothetical protein